MTTLGKLWTAGIAYVALAVGAGLSIMYNVLQTITIRGPELQVWDIVTAVAMPGLVVLMVELFVSTLWIGQPWYVQGAVRWLACVTIGGVAMRASWTHGHAWMLGHGHAPDVAVMWPLAIDLLAVLATALLLAGRRTGQVDTTADTGQVDTTADSGQVIHVCNNNCPDTCIGQDMDTGQDRLPIHVTQHPPNAGGHWTADSGHWASRMSAALSDGFGSGFAGQDTDSPLPRRTADTDKLSELSIAEETERYLSGLDYRTEDTSATQPLPPAVRSVSARSGALSDEQRAEVRLCLAVARKHGHYTETEARTLLAAWYGVHPRTIKRAEGR